MNGLRLAKRQSNGHRGPAVRPTLDFNLAIMAAHVSQADTQPQPSSLSAFGREKRFKPCGRTSGGITQPVSTMRISTVSVEEFAQRIP